MTRPPVHLIVIFVLYNIPNWMHYILYHRKEIIMKHLSALFTALVITAIVGLGIVVIGVSALTNTNTVALQNSPNSSLTATGPSGAGGTAASATPSTDAQQLQQQVNALQSQLNQADQALQQYQSLFMSLQQRGVIYVDGSGNIYLPQGESGELH